MIVKSAWHSNYCFTEFSNVLASEVKPYDCIIFQSTPFFVENPKQNRETGLV